MLKFVLILTVWHADIAPDVYVLDHNMTGEDCINSLSVLYPLIARGELSCQIDGASQ